MKAEDVYNIAIHLSDSEFKRLNKLIETRLKPKSRKKTPEIDMEIIKYLIKLHFSKNKNDKK